MRVAGLLGAALIAGMSGTAFAEGQAAPVVASLASVQPAVAQVAMVPLAVRAVLPAAMFRVRTIVAPVNRTFRLNDPDSMLHSGYAGLFDLFPFQGGKFHLSGGSRLFSRVGRFRTTEPESLQYLQPFRAGSLRASRKFRPALLVGYGRVVEQGFSFGIDAGFVKGKIGAMPDRLGRLNRSRLASLDGLRRPNGLNEVARITALYRF